MTDSSNHRPTLYILAPACTWYKFDVYMGLPQCRTPSCHTEDKHNLHRLNTSPRVTALLFPVPSYIPMLAPFLPKPLSCRTLILKPHAQTYLIVAASTPSQRRPCRPHGRPTRVRPATPPQQFCHTRAALSTAAAVVAACAPSKSGSHVGVVCCVRQRSLNAQPKETNSFKGLVHATRRKRRGSTGAGSVQRTL